MESYLKTIESPVGKLTLVASEKGLSAILWEKDDSGRTGITFETRTYGQIAKQIGNPQAVRAVGGAANKNPVSIIAPCHRVIGATDMEKTFKQTSLWE
eukprot:gene9758-12381_t